MGNRASSGKKSKKSKKKKNDTNADEFNIDEKDAGDFTSDPLPVSIEKILAKHEEKEAETTTIKAFGGPLSAQRLTEGTPSILILLKKYLLQYNASKHVGIFANGSTTDEDINSSPEFIPNGVVSLDDCKLVRNLIEMNKITENKLVIPNYKNDDKHYAMIFAELIKIWLYELELPLLQTLPSTFFDGLTTVDYLELDIEKIPEPQLSSLILLWDICVEIDAHKAINQMDASIMSRIFAPYLYKEKDAERHAQIIDSITNFFEVGIKWRTERRFTVVY